MRITINTKEDSHEDIRSVIALLSKMIEGKESHSNIFESSSSDSSSEASPSAFVNMFGSDEPSSEPSTPSVEEDVPVLGESSTVLPESSTVLEEKEEEEEEPAELIEY